MSIALLISVLCVVLYSQGLSTLKNNIKKIAKTFAQNKFLPYICTRNQQMAP